jgi:RNA polymerase sigma-70 factor (ECF subfamily)
MVGSAHDAEDLVQETYLRAWRSHAGFEGRASIRSRLYRIATNVCLTALQPRRHRVPPSGLTGPEGSDHPPRRVAPGEVAWLEPWPDHWIAPSAGAPDAGDPAATVVARESLRLALIASLQHLPARQRAILILREVLAFSAAETAEILGTTTAAVKSGLQRARARLDGPDPEREELLEPTDARTRALLGAYIAAFEQADARLLEHVLRADATLEATPFRDWQAGRVNSLRMLASYVLGEPGDWRLIPTTANGQPAAVEYHRHADGVLRAEGVVVLSATATGVSRVVSFHDPALVARFGFADTLAG